MDYPILRSSAGAKQDQSPFMSSPPLGRRGVHPRSLPRLDCRSGSEMRGNFSQRSLRQPPHSLLVSTVVGRLVSPYRMGVIALGARGFVRLH